MMPLLDFEVGLDRPLFLIAGPCVIESAGLAEETAGVLKEMTAELGIHFIYKSSFDKANRSSAGSFRGPGMEQGLAILEQVRARIQVPVLTDVHEDTPLAEVAAVVDVLQTPAFLCRQTNFIQSVARQGKPVNIKKGQFLAPWDMRHVVEKARATGNDRLLVCERGYTSDTTIWCRTCARSRCCARPVARWSSMPPIQCSCREGRAIAPAVSVSSSRCWPVPRSRSGSLDSSWRPIRILSAR